MTFADWVRQSRQRFQTQPIGQATAESLREFYRGGIRRTVDPFVGRAWWERDWGVLVVLDAMRVDLAREVFDEDVRAVWSPASTSIDWIERHFDERYRHEWESAAYVTANPFADHDADARSADLHDVNLGWFEPVYETGWQPDPVGTTPPEIVTDAALDVWQQCQSCDRMIVHYMQPHQPFRSRPEWEHVYSNLQNLVTGVNKGGPDIWNRVRLGELEEAAVWEAYADNLRWAWDEVEDRLLSGLDKSDRVLVTSDHGNGLGEWGVWGHPPGDVAPQVRRVPMLGPYFGEGETVDVDSKDRNEADVGVQAQLDALGYADGGGEV